MAKKSRNWINRHESWWNKEKTRTLKFEHLERILDDYERELRLSAVSNSFDLLTDEQRMEIMSKYDMNTGIKNENCC